MRKHLVRGLHRTRRVQNFARMVGAAKGCAAQLIRVVLGHGASGNAASMKPYVVGFKRRGIDAIAVDLPRGGAERAVPVFMRSSAEGSRSVEGSRAWLRWRRTSEVSCFFRIPSTAPASPTSAGSSTFRR